MSSATLHDLSTEREELHWVLTSGVLGRSTNLVRMLTFICERYFEGRPEEITEYSVAVEALGRRADFDPHTDTIVRVTTHLLRKRLHEVYAGEGASRPIRIDIPPGKYVPSFIPNEAYVDPEPIEQPEPVIAIQPETVPLVAATATKKRSNRRILSLVAAVAALTLITIFVIRLSLSKPLNAPRTIAALPVPRDTVRALVGSGREAYVDHSGNLWQPAKSCVGGASLPAKPQRILGTEDAELYLGGLRGIAHCTFPAGPGMHEVHLYFAETTGLEPVRRKAIVSLNGGPDLGVDVADLAGGVGGAVSRVWTGIEPERDGLIHLDYTSEVSPLNAVEILPAPSDQLLPVRIVAGDARVTDESGNVWQADRYFLGGRRGAFADADAVKPGELGIYDSDRVGRMRYTVPVVAGARYRVRLYFREPWFGRQNGGGFGPGARVFNVSVNGTMMLKDFDILARGNGKPVVETLEDVQGSPEGEIELTFSSVVNHPLINAIEVIPEP
jgi:hypothetical protein